MLGPILSKERKLIHQGYIIALYNEYDDGKDYDILVHPGAVAMIALLDDKIVLVEQQRRGAAKMTLELPAGCLEEGEAPEVTANRELQEEIGYKAASITKVTEFYTAPSFSTEKVHLYCCENLSPSQLPSDDDEEITLKILTIKEALALVKKGIIDDVKTIVGIQWIAMEKKIV